MIESGGNRPLGRPLVYGPVGHRVGKRISDFKDVRARVNIRFQDRLTRGNIRIAR